VAYQIQNDKSKEFIGEALLSKAGEKISIPTGKISEDTDFNVVAFNTITRCVTSLSKKLSVKIVREIDPNDYKILQEIFAGTNNAKSPWFPKVWLFTGLKKDFEDKGVTFLDTKVSKIDLSNNNLYDRLPESINNLTALVEANLSNNKLTFYSLEKLANFSKYNYKRADPYLNDNSLTVKVLQGEDATPFKVDTKGEFNQYQWTKNGQDLTEDARFTGTKTNNLQIKKTLPSDEGLYVCRITNSRVPELSLFWQVNLKVVTSLPPSEPKELLIALYKALGGDKWTKPWNISEPMETWYGLTMENGKIVEVNLINNNLTGNLAAFEDVFSDPNGIFANVRNLNLTQNHLKGEVPTSLKQLKSLKVLDLSGNELKGKTPEILGELTDLTDLNLAYNELDALDPSMTNLTKLKNLFLNNNRFTQLPSELFKLSNLELLKINNNRITTLPPDFEKLTKLKYLSLANNGLNTLPLSITKLIDLEELDLSYNELSNLPNGLENLEKLKRISIKNNRLTFEVILRFSPSGQGGRFAGTVDYAPQAKIGNEKTFINLIGETVRFEMQGSEGKGNQYQWFRNSEPIKDNLSARTAQLILEAIDKQTAGKYSLQIINPSAPDLILFSYDYQLVVNCGSVKDAQIRIALGNTQYCQGETINAQLEAVVKGDYQYQWLLNKKMLVGAQAANYSAASAGEYSLLLTDKNGCQYPVNQFITISRYEAVKVSIEMDANGLLRFVSASEPITNFRWEKDGIEIAEALGKEWKAKQAGKYRLIVTSESGCRSASDYKIVDAITAIDEMESEDWKLYPNPVQERLKLETQKTLQKARLQIINMNGQIIYQRTLDQTDSKMDIDVKALPAGMYVLRVQSQDILFQRKFTKE
jgi:Leucine-rich repeat (LRR) protein